MALAAGLALASLLFAGQVLAQTADSQTSCVSQTNNKWCLNSDGATGWCAYNVGSSYNCPAYNATDCSAQGGEWCTPSGGGTGWCNSTPGSCPINDKATCESKSRSWCTPQSGGGWCTYSSTEKCPAYTEADCKAQSRTWCVSPGSASTNGWCTDSCPYSPTVDQKTQCTTANGKWCLNSDGATGYCSYSATACPAYNATDCTAQGGDWCAYSSGTGGYCNSTPNSCPINDKGTCEAKSRKWCSSSYGGGWCATSNESCPSSTNTTTPTTPTAPDYSSWPMTESDCSLYSGLWCKSTGGYYSTYSGSCMMANNTCPVTPKAGYMTCWDNTEVPNTSSCPVSPTNEADCTKLSRYWCKSTYTSSYGGSSSSGWCQGNPCSLSPPAGQMTCPDGKTFASSMSSCPKKSTTPTSVPEPVTVLCPDGITKAPIGATCPVSYTCSNGIVVKSVDQCPKQDEVSTCLNKGGVWCKDPSGVKSGYCAAQASECKTMYPPQPVPTPPPEVKPVPVYPEEPISASEVKQDKRNMLRELKDMERFFKPLKEEALLARIAVVREKVNNLAGTTRAAYYEARQVVQDEVNGLRTEVEKQNLLQELKNMERVFKSLKDEAMLAKIAAMRDEINKMTVADRMARKEGMTGIFDEMEDLRYAMQDAQESGRVIEPERDKKFQEQALRDMKKSTKSFERFLVTFESKVKKVEKQGIIIDSSIKDLVVKAKELVARAKEAKTYDEAKEIMDQMPELGEDLNEMLSRLEQLSRLPEALKVINRRVVDVERAIKTTAATAKRLKIDAADEIQKMQSLLTEAKEAIVKLKTGTVEDAETFFEYIQESIMEKLDEALTTAQMVQTVANVKKYVNKVAADLKRFDRRIVQLEKKNEDMSEARALLDEAKTHLEDLRVAATKKLNMDVADEIIEHLGSLFSLDDQLEEVLKLTAPDELERQLRRLFEGASKEQLKSFEVGLMEKTMVKAYQTANFFRLTPARSMAIVAE